MDDYTWALQLDLVYMLSNLLKRLNSLYVKQFVEEIKFVEEVDGFK